MFDRIDRAALGKALSRPVATRSLIVAAVVGTILNVINQGPDILAGKPPHLFRLALTYVVPFLVSSYGAYAAFSRVAGAGEDRGP